MTLTPETGVWDPGIPDRKSNRKRAPPLPAARMGDKEDAFALAQEESKKKIDWGNDQDDQPSAAEYAKQLLLGGVGLFGGGGSDGDVRHPPSFFYVLFQRF